MDALAIIGTAGRGKDASRINRELYDAMYKLAVETAREWGETSLVSGGAAVADHLAVRAFNEGVADKLTLFLPAEFKDGFFVPDNAIQFNPGATLNRYHGAFSMDCGIDSLEEIAQAIERGADVIVKPGFHNRNIEVAAARSMIAMTFTPAGRSGRGELVETFTPNDEGFSSSKDAGLRDGGTAHTWGECWNAQRKRHVNLARLEADLRTKPSGMPNFGF